MSEPIDLLAALQASIEAARAVRSERLGMAEAAHVAGGARSKGWKQGCEAATAVAVRCLKEAGA